MKEEAFPCGRSREIIALFFKVAALKLTSPLQVACLEMEPLWAGPGRLESGMKGNSASSLLSKPRGIYERLFI